jgi:hypothetical protein
MSRIEEKKSNINTIKKNIEHKYSILKEKCSSPISGSEFWLLLCNICESKMQSEQYFSRKQRALLPQEKGRFLCLLKTWGGLGPPVPTPLYVLGTLMIGNRENLYIDAIMPMQILMVELIFKKMTQYI